MPVLCQVGLTMEGQSAAKLQLQNPPAFEAIFPSYRFPKLLEGEKYGLGSGYTIRYSKESSTVLLECQNPFKPVQIAFNVNGGKITEIHQNGGTVEDLKQHLSENGKHGLGYIALKTLGLTEIECKAERREFEALDGNVPLFQYKSIWQYEGDMNNITPVGQGAAKVMEVNLGDDVGLYTYHATSCTILIGVCHDYINNKIIRIGMAHIDAGVDRASVHEFLQKLKKNPGDTLEIYIIGGTSADEIYTISKNYGKINCLNSNQNLEKGRFDAAAVNSKGEVYYERQKNDDNPLWQTQKKLDEWNKKHPGDIGENRPLIYE